MKTQQRLDNATHGRVRSTARSRKAAAKSSPGAQSIAHIQGQRKAGKCDKPTRQSQLAVRVESRPRCEDTVSSPSMATGPCVNADGSAGEAQCSLKPYPGKPDVAIQSGGYGSGPVSGCSLERVKEGSSVSLVKTNMKKQKKKTYKKHN